MHSSPPFPGLRTCGFTLVSNDQLLVACITFNSSLVVHRAYKEAAQEVTVYQVREEAYGAGKLSVQRRQSIEVENPVDVEMW